MQAPKRIVDRTVGQKYVFKGELMIWTGKRWHCEHKRRKNRCKECNTECNPVRKELETIKPNKKLNLSIINSNTAKNGYIEEGIVCHDLNTNKAIRAQGFLPSNFDECSKLKGNHKVDIMSKDKKLTAQVKKYKKGQFQQLDRHYLDHIIAYIPELKKIEGILRGVYEVPLKNDGKYIDKTKGIIELSDKNYTEEELILLLKILNKNIRKILEYAFYGVNQSIAPIYLIGAEYEKGENGKRLKLVFYKIEDIINYLTTLTFKINKLKTVISLGKSPSPPISLQRKGGDGGRKSSNHLQFKIIVSSLQSVKHFEYKL